MKLCITDEDYQIVANIWNDAFNVTMEDVDKEGNGPEEEVRQFRLGYFAGALSYSLIPHPPGNPLEQSLSERYFSQPEAELMQDLAATGRELVRRELIKPSQYNRVAFMLNLGSL